MKPGKKSTELPGWGTAAANMVLIVLIAVMVGTGLGASIGAALDQGAAIPPAAILGVAGFVLGAVVGLIAAAVYGISLADRKRASRKARAT